MQFMHAQVGGENEWYQDIRDEKEWVGILNALWRTNQNEGERDKGGDKDEQGSYTLNQENNVYSTSKSIIEFSLLWELV